MNKNELAIAAIRSTCIDMINKANSGHPGMALGSAPILFALYKDHLISDPYDSKWINRDRFILSAGHASSLLYTMLHICDYPLSMDDLKSFRQIGSKTPGHPEVGHTVGVDSTSGPLGQGLAQAVGVAIAESHLNAKNPDIINHYTYCLCGDGCLQEGISQEAISLAGLLKLNKLILMYDCNDVTLDGPLSTTSIENTKQRFLAENWNVLEVSDGNDYETISKMISKAKEEKERPTIIIIKTVIGYGSAVQGTSKAHGAPLSAEDVVNTKKFYGYNEEPFTIPNEVYSLFKKEFADRGLKAQTAWQVKLDKMYKKDEIDLSVFLNDDMSSLLKDNFEDFDNSVEEATRKSSQRALEYYYSKISNLIGGSADVAGSVLTTFKGITPYNAENRTGTDMFYGIREFAMASTANGIALHGGLRPYVGCFMVFSDYMKSAIRMSSISNLPTIYIFSHDSIGVGEDGPTHQPIEQLAMLRSIPNNNVIRPCDARETFAAYKVALLSKDNPTCIVTSRGNVPFNTNSSYEGVEKGGYIISKEVKKPELVVIATGTEVSLVCKTKELLKDKMDIRVVSMPSINLFDKQSEEYKRSVLGSDYNKCVFVEMGASYGLYKYAKHVYAIDTFGASGKAKEVEAHFGFTPEKLAEYLQNIK